MVEPDRQQAIAGDVLAAAMAAPCADVLLQVAQGLGGRLLVGLEHLGGGPSIPQPIQQRHALGRPPHHVKGGHAPLAVGAAKQLPGVGVATVEDVDEPLGGRRPLLAERRGAAAEPAAW